MKSIKNSIEFTTIFLLLVVCYAAAGSVRRSLYSGSGISIEAQDEAITLLDQQTTQVQVSIQQTFFGDATDECEDDDEYTAMLMFATYLDPVYFNTTCGFYRRSVDACYKRNLWIGCNAETNTATIELYIVDECFSSLSITENPKIGRCVLGSAKTIPRAIKLTQTFDCLVEAADPLPGQAPGTCSDIHHECAKGSYCNLSSTRGYECKYYAPMGQKCGGRTLLGEDGRCNPALGYCYYPNGCKMADIPGVCRPFKGVCKIDSFCTDPITEYCDESVGKCKQRVNVGECCSVADDHCCESATCAPDGGSFTCQAV